MSSTVARALKLGQLCVVVLAAWWLLSQIAVTTALDSLTGLHPSVLFAVGGLTVLEFGTRFGTWYGLLHRFESTTILRIARADLVIKFINHVIPSKVSGHSVAPLVLRHVIGLQWQTALAVATLNTGLYAVLYGVTSVVAVLLLASVVPAGLLVALGGSTLLYLTVGVAVIVTGSQMAHTQTVLQRLSSVVSSIPVAGQRAATILDGNSSLTVDSQATFRSLGRSPKVLVVYVLCWLGTLVVIPGLRVVVLLSGLGTTGVSTWTIPLALVLAYSVTILPITPGGVGVTELSASLVLVGIGIPEGTAVTVILVDRTLGVYLPAVLGWVPAARIDIAATAERTD
jgi:uncharacterized protein (TIRG00374 family)